jgi:hypothetical protein
MNEKPDMGNEYLTMLLEHLSECRTRSINAIFEVLLIDKDGEHVLISYRTNRSLQKSFGNFGFLRFNSQTNLGNKYVKDGQIQFLCTITMLENSSNEYLAQKTFVRATEFFSVAGNFAT